MSAFFTQLGILNSACRDTFATESIIYQPRLNNANSGAAVTLSAIPLDPIRLEGQASGQFTVRWVSTDDLNSAQITPMRGDRITIPITAHTVGGVYTVMQIQEDVGGGVRFILTLRENRITGIAE